MLGLTLRLLGVPALDLAYVRPKSAYAQQTEATILYREYAERSHFLARIDKSSRAELSETINSMFRRYSNAAVCYVYLSDVRLISDEISSSRWFTRG
jgi:hypothetical protein